jgi:hypothetical protein
MIFTRNTNIKRDSKVLIITFWELHLGSINQLLVHNVDLVLINEQVGGLQYWGFNQNKVGVTKKYLS